MASSISFFPELDKTLIENLKLKIDYNFFYYPRRSDTLKEINHRNENGVISLITKNLDVNPDTYDLYLVVVITFQDGYQLYGENGIAPTNGELSFGLEVFSQKSRYRQFLSGKTSIIKNKPGNERINIQCILPKATFKNDLTMNLRCYLSKSDEFIPDSESYLNNEVGVVLGTVSSVKMSFGSYGSLFPIYDEISSSKSLWELQIDYIDPAEDLLFNSVKLKLNKKHKDYKYLDVNNKNYCDSLIKSIMISAVTAIITDVLNKNELSSGVIYPDDTIFGFIQYFKKHIDSKDSLDSPLGISQAVRNFVYSKEE